MVEALGDPGWGWLGSSLSHWVGRGKEAPREGLEVALLGGSPGGLGQGVTQQATGARAFPEWGGVLVTSGV